MTALLKEGVAAVPGAGRNPGSPRRRPGESSRFKRSLMPWLFLAPALILFTLFKFIPMIRAVEMSFFDVQPYTGDIYVGTENYEQVLTSPAFTGAIVNTLVLAVATTIGAMFLGLVLALLLEGSAKSLWLVRTAVFLPAVVAMAVVAEIWRVLMYPAPNGLLNSVIGYAGLGPSEFLNSSDTSLLSIFIVGVWKGAPYDMMIILAGLAGVDRTLYEAAAIDGAGPLRRVFSVTLPQLRGVLVILLTLAAIRGLRVFTEVFLLTNGGPAGSSEVLMTLIYKLGLERNEMGVAAAGSVVLLVATVALTLLVRLLSRRKGV